MWLKLVVVAVLLGCVRTSVVRLGKKLPAEPTGGPAPAPGRVFVQPPPRPTQAPAEDSRDTSKRFRPGKVVNTEEEIRLRMFDEDAAEDDVQSELRFIKTLGKGGYGTVYLAFDNRLQMTVACKTFDKPIKPTSSRREKYLIDLGSKHNALQEMFMLLYIPNHKNLCQFLRYLEDDRRIYVVLEFCGGHTLRDFSERFTPEAQIKQYFRQEVAGLKALHDNNVAHLDFKLANIMVNDQDEVKIIDYSTSVFNITKIGTGFGPGGYEAPECFLPGLKDPRKLDIWALGVGLYRLLYGFKPFGFGDKPEDRDRLLSYKFEFGYRKVSEEVKDLLRHIFVPADQRYTLEQIQKHAWLSI